MGRLPLLAKNLDVFNFGEFVKGIRIVLRVIFATSLFAGGANAATIECENLDHTGAVHLIGTVVAGDHEKVVSCWESLTQPTKENRAQLAELNKKEPGRYKFVEKLHITLAVSSKGGLVTEAMKIGRYARSKKMWVAVPQSGECFSSCVYILASGVVKFPFGTIGIHRPYFLSAPNQSYDFALKAVLRESKAFFQEMNVPDTLADDMFSIPPSEIMTLGDGLLAKYRLNQDDMAYAEQSAMENSAFYRLSRQEYMARRKLSEKYMDECLAKFRGNASTRDIVACGGASDRKAGLVPRN